MARFRPSLREASRFGGGNNEYDRGYQYRLPRQEVLRLGPFRRVWPLGERNVPQDTLQSLKDGILRDGIIYPAWGRTSATAAGRTVLNVDEYGLIPSLFNIVFYRDNGDTFLKVAFSDGVTSGVDASTIVSDGSPVAAAPWQKYLYFGNTVLAGIRRYSPVDHAFTTVAGTPNPKFLFFLDNNLVAIYKSGNSWVGQWSADSLPETWTGAGTGQLVFPPSIGEIKGVSHLTDSVVVIGSRGAVQLQATGLASPAFRMNNVDAIQGTPFESVASYGDLVYYISYKRNLVVFNGNSVEPVSTGIPFFNAQPNMYPSSRLGALIVSKTDEEKTYLLDTDINEWVGELDFSFNFISDAPAVHTSGLVVGYKDAGNDTTEVTLNLDPVTYRQPTLETGRIDLGTELWVEYVDIIRTTITNPTPVLRVLRQLRDGTVDISSFTDPEVTGVNEQGTQVRYWVNAPAMFIELQFGVLEAEGPYLLSEYTPEDNIYTNAGNPSGSFRSELDINGNSNIYDGAVSYVGESIDGNGNLVLAAADLVRDDIWLEASGVEYMEVMLQAQTNEPSNVR